MHAIRCWRYNYLITPSYGRIGHWIETLKPIPISVEWPAERRALEDLDHVL